MYRITSLLFIFIISLTTPLLADMPFAHPTFHCIGLYWSPGEGSADNTCSVFYRMTGQTEWQQAMNLWYDDQPHEGASDFTNQYRGSLVNLFPGTDYDVKLVLESGTEETLTVSTWDENFKIKETIIVPAGESNDYLNIREGGSEEEGYVLYTPPAGQEAIIDGKNEISQCIRLSASWVIIRGLTLRGAKQHGIVLGNCNHVVIEDCDISGWGRIDDDGWGKNFDSAIYSGSSTLENIIIQRNKLHHPRSDSNAWEEDGHPEGPQGITFVNGKGRYVIRYNEIYGDTEHYFNDSMGEYHNFSYAGFPNRDSDIYCNKISHCWDDAIEAEGANMNVRIWSNLLDSTYVALGLATTSLGPNYVFRNVSHFSQRAPKPVNKYWRSGGFIKLGNENTEYTRGKMYILHNTIAQPPSPWIEKNVKTSGCERGIASSWTTKHQTNIYGRNNILCVNTWPNDKTSIYMADNVASNDFDYDLYNGTVPEIDGCEANGVQIDLNAEPAFDPYNDTFEFFLEPATEGYDAGQPLFNFNDGFEGKAPDIGAFETDRPALVWGVNADWTAWMQQSGVRVEHPSLHVPKSLQLGIYPNPFNPTTTVSFHLHKTAQVTISIFNITGQQVEFHNLGQKNAGAHTFVWNAGKHVSGTFFVRLKAGDQQKISKCILLK